ncbi:MAG: U32 family peptidase [Solobacterium sp.]|nr:U32 family peptidase [Solobacterium sp.]
MKKVELLSPAGDLKRCITAINYGADAVYIGGKSFSLRSRASNFTMDDIREACTYANAKGAHIHVTVNMIPHDEDLEGLTEYLQQLEEAGVKAIIVASPYIMKLAKSCTSKLEVHCSTQMSVTNAEAAQFLYEQYGIDRVVLARECTLDDVRKITASCPIETESFIHGGMCVNFSGRCTLSNRMTLRDANRGGCAQSCRWSYHLYEGQEEISKDLLFTMGSKDLCAVPYIYDLMEAGVSSFKIEGRMKTEYYVASVVKAYRNLIDEIYANNGPLSNERMIYHEKQVMRAANREVWPGFYQGSDDNSLIYHNNGDAFVSHDFLGTVKAYDPQRNTAVIESRNVFQVGDTVEFLSPSTSNQPFTIESITNGKNEQIDSIRNPMSLVEIPVSFAVQKEDILRKAL